VVVYLEINYNLLGDQVVKKKIVEHILHNNLSSYDNYGPSPRKVKLLDGMFLAVRSETLLKYNIHFDENFLFHFYDLDLSRQFELYNLSIGTWPISVIHSGTGHLTESWESQRMYYMQKWDSIDIGELNNALLEEEINGWNRIHHNHNHNKYINDHTIH